MSKTKLTVSIQERNNAFMLVDNQGYICGIFNTKELADKAIRATEQNINRGRVHKWLLPKSFKVVRLQNRQVSSKNSTAQGRHQAKSST